MEELLNGSGGIGPRADAMERAVREPRQPKPKPTPLPTPALEQADARLKTLPAMTAQDFMLMIGDQQVQIRRLEAHIQWLTQQITTTP